MSNFTEYELELLGEIAKLREQLAKCEESGAELLAAFNRAVGGDTYLGEPKIPNDFKDAYIGAREDLLLWKQRAEAAEAKPKALEEQGPVALAERNTESFAGWINELRLLSEHRLIDQGWLREAIRTIWLGIAKYAEPVDVQELKSSIEYLKAYIEGQDESFAQMMKGRAELERKLAEQQAAIAHAYVTLNACEESDNPSHGVSEVVRILAKGDCTQLDVLIAQARGEGRREAVIPVAKAYAWSQSLFKGAHRCTSSGDAGDAETLNDIANWILAGAPEVKP